jgi:predicted ribosome quality control (RQC) complex YloA/Tae2 family protein
MSIRDVYENKMQARLDELKARLEVFKEKADQEETNLQLEYYTLIDEVKLELETAHKKLQRLKQSGDETWEEFKAEVETTWDSLDELIRSLTLP